MNPKASLKDLTEVRPIPSRCEVSASVWPLMLCESPAGATDFLTAIYSTDTISLLNTLLENMKIFLLICRSFKSTQLNFCTFIKTQRLK